MNMVTLPPGTIITLSGETSTEKRRCRSAGDRLAQGQDAGRRRIAVMAVAQRLDGGLDDVRRRREIRLADAEIDDVAARGRPARSRARAPRRRSPRRCGEKAGTMASMGHSSILASPDCGAFDSDARALESNRRRPAQPCVRREARASAVDFDCMQRVTARNCARAVDRGDDEWLSGRGACTPDKLRSRLWFDNPDNPGMTALYLERYLNYGLTAAGAAVGQADHRHRPDRLRPLALQPPPSRARQARARRHHGGGRRRLRVPVPSDPGDRQAPDRLPRPQPRLLSPRRGALRLPARRRRAADRLRQDHAGLPDGGGDRRTSRRSR